MRSFSSWILVAALAGCALASAPPPEVVEIHAPSGTYQLEKRHASVVVRANHMGFSHYPVRMTGLDATLEFDAAAPENSSLSATIDPRSIRTEFPQRELVRFDEVLAGPNWLDAAAYPSITFRSTSITRTGPRSARIAGDLTLHGVTRTITLEATFNGSSATHPVRGSGPAMLGFSARGQILRSQFGMTTLLPPENTQLGVGDAIELQIEAEFQRADT